jgi:CspA family cold shock protein
MINSTNKGTVRFFLKDKGYGFILDDDELDEKGEHRQFFFHVTNTLDKIDKDDKVEYNLIEGKKGLNAVSVKRKKGEEGKK